MVSMIDLFLKHDGVAVPELTPGAEWVLEQPAVVHRLHNTYMDLDLRKRFGFKSWYFEYDGVWERTTLKECDPLAIALARPPHDSYMEEFTPQRYGLIKKAGWRLVPDRDATQLANFQNLELHLENDVERVYDDLRDTFSYVYEDGIVFKSLDFKRRVKLHRSDFELP